MNEITFHDLPTDMVRFTLSKLYIPDLLACTRVSHRMNQLALPLFKNEREIVDDKAFAAIWKVCNISSKSNSKDELLFCLCLLLAKAGFFRQVDTLLSQFLNENKKKSLRVKVAIEEIRVGFFSIISEPIIKYSRRFPAIIKSSNNDAPFLISLANALCKLKNKEKAKEYLGHVDSQSLNLNLLAKYFKASVKVKETADEALNLYKLKIAKLKTCLNTLAAENISLIIDNRAYRIFLSHLQHSTEQKFLPSRKRTAEDLKAARSRDKSSFSLDEFAQYLDLELDDTLDRLNEVIARKPTTNEVIDDAKSVIDQLCQYVTGEKLDDWVVKENLKVFKKVSD